MTRLPLLPALALALCLIALPHPAHADGIIVPDAPPSGCSPSPLQSGPLPAWQTPVPIRPCPPTSALTIVYHRVEVTIDDQVAVTKVDQTFRNDGPASLEGTYIFPLPPDSSVTKFALWVGGQQVDGQVLKAEEARALYEDIVRRQRDPALLEYLGRGAVRARVFPIGPGQERRVQLEYTQTLPLENGLVHYRYPLATEKFSAQPLNQVNISVQGHSTQPFRAIYSPSHPLAISQDGEHDFRAGYEATQVTPNTDFDLYYSTASSGIGLNLLTYRDPSASDADGWFLLLASPGLEGGEEQVAKDVIIVLDRSGSMGGEKLRQAQQAVQFVLEHLKAEDRFGLLAFSTDRMPYASELLPASARREAEQWVSSLSAEGTTDLNRALLTAATLSRSDRPTYIIFLTDGLPTEGVTSTPQILRNFDTSAPANIRLFVFGVGNDVDTVLLDSLAEAHHGATTYVRPGERIDEAISSFYARITSPVLTDVRVDLGDLTTYDVYPQSAPDLFAGSQLVLAGRYRGDGTTTIRLSGKVNGEPRTYSYEGLVFASSGGQSALPRLWATRKIGFLLNEIRLHGPQREAVDEIVALSVRYGIVTPYTSFLVTEPGALSESDRQRIGDQTFQDLQTVPTQVAGAPAVQKAQEQSRLAGANSAPVPDTAEAQARVRTAGSRTFLLTEGVWCDTEVDLTRTTTTKVAFGTSDYFKLASLSPDLAAALALGPRVIVLWQGRAYEVVEAGGALPSVVLPLSPTPEPTPEKPPDPASAHPGQEARPATLPCPTSLLPLGMVALVGALRGRKR